MGDDDGLDDDGIRERLTKLDELLGQLERIPGQTAANAMEAVEALTDVYGEALARVMDRVDDGATRRRIAEDELLAHLLVLHDLHPDPLAERVKRGLDDARPQLRANGVEADLTGVDGGVAHVAVSGGSCGCSSSSVEGTISDSVLAMAPELSAVESRTAPAEAPVIPVETLLHKPAGERRRA